MVAIKNTEMPSDCAECPFCNHLKTNDYGSYGDCAILGDKERMNLLLHEKHSDCPLVEIVTCKDCKHWVKELSIRVPDDKEYHFCPMMDCNTAEDFFCGDGKRRE